MANEQATIRIETPAGSPPLGWLCACGPRLATLWLVKLLGLTTGMTAFFAAYFWVLQHPSRPPFIMPLTAVDRLVPFQPFTLPAYLSLWVYVSLAPALMITRRDLVAFGIGAAGLSVTGLGIFLLSPTAVPAPPVTWANDSLFAFLKATDATGNACPSLHVAFAVFVGWVLAYQLRQLRAGPVARAGNGLWCAGIIYSTLATRQHVFLDAAAGLALGAVFGALLVRRWQVTSPTVLPPE